MIEFPFFCPACQTQTDAKADPVGLLFGGAAPLIVTCTNCETQFGGEVEREESTLGRVHIKRELPKED